MKKLLSLLALAMALSIGTQAVAPRNAEAVMLLLIASGNDHVIRHPSLPAIVLCVLFLPACVLDQKTGDSSITPSDLLDNGYTQSQVDSIVMDQTALTAILKDRGQQLVIEKTDSRDSIRRVLRGLIPSISDDYVNFVADMNGIR